jgi:hypothetical protein
MDADETRAEAMQEVESEPDNFSEDYDNNTEYADKNDSGDDDKNDSDDDDDSDKEVEYDDEDEELPDPWRISIKQTLHRVRQENNDENYPDNVLKEPQFSEFVEELQKSVKGCIDQADAFSSDSTYKIIMKHFSKLDDHTDGHDSDETLEAAWMDKKTYIKNRLLDNMDLFDIDDDEESINPL